MDALDVSRWQFGITTVYHFIFVPLTIGLAPILAVMQTAWVITDNPAWYRLTRFFGKLFLINFAIGVATGIVQEFQFGMNWSEYSRFVGDIFGAPLAFEGLVAFFFESTFIGLWIFGWSRLPRLVHLACIWIVAIAVNASAYFIIAANSFMQHPVGARYNPESGRAELTDFGALLTNNTAVWAFQHAVAGALLTAGAFVAGVSAFLMVRAQRNVTEPTVEARTMYRPAAIGGSLLALVAAVGLFVTGDVQGKLMFDQQPMKMASAESLCDTATDPDFSILTVGTHNNCDSVIHVLDVPYVLPFLAEGQFSGVTLEGVNDLQAQYEERFGPGDYRPNLFVTYWAFRAMIGLLLVPVAFALVTVWLTRRGRIPNQRWYGWAGVLTIPTPFLANSAGWVFTEMGRQPWVVVPNPTGDQLVRMTVQDGVSNHSAGMVLFSLVMFTLVYGALAVVWFGLMRRYVLKGPQEHDSEPAPPSKPDDEELAPLSFAY
ncbi:cytochrome ubiquinol oxidase subunit I [Mycolicibacterium monacense]|uniref:Cytochrome ubiquinol oxidase subunit I n=2 Tax=Mycobacteriaceae TaxID=1762 RepID=A0AAD1MZ43_MYCMB|nr:cytochrome ubiquinol oxidase subunit I [Mycolicibacterium monacense]MDA4101980.1 cytochrome BD ubiquinol oxidase subunit I [Mycolicibacterium monacense DSM 44395]OBB66235.1 cytochrome BD ubiquinol oxidase subunit I [Mycolicibacterium monacense]ORB16209.1 cytochrome ubiquinol oxidase subunit I [Mycolicibacterium monacense DSM 44395]QHP86727.1 cytochrome ubiquinol oxidase subunit I [Mycolicibacterium monacense DSM 44395]BBZ60205.1 cytochrome ubiquinol oxidase subunit I [Mycolicibacterium mona